MRNRVGWYVGVAVLATTLSACGSGGTDDGEAVADVPDDVSTVFGEPVEPSEADRTVEVAALDTMAYEPATIEVSPGEVITFSVTNQGQAVHEFTLGDEATQQEHEEEMSEMGSGMDNEEPNTISLEPGQTRELTWRFPESGTVLYACHEPGHYQAGMQGAIAVG
jgi:uncharacterized cupredoxin-like copper-binding protein